MTNQTEEFYQLAFLLSRGDSDLSASVASSVNSPQIYIDTHTDDMENRGISTPIKELPWIALADGLDKKGKLAELDWKEDKEEFIQATINLLKNDNASEQTIKSLVLLDLEGEDDVPDLLKLINQILRPFDYAIILININSDSYPITLSKIQTLPKIKELASQIGSGNLHFF